MPLMAQNRITITVIIIIVMMTAVFALLVTAPVFVLSQQQPTAPSPCSCNSTQFCCSVFYHSTSQCCEAGGTCCPGSSKLFCCPPSPAGPMLCAGHSCCNPDTQDVCGDPTSDSARCCDKDTQECVSNQQCAWRRTFAPYAPAPWQPWQSIFYLGRQQCGTHMLFSPQQGKSSVRRSFIICYGRGMPTRRIDKRTGAEIWANTNVSGQDFAALSGDATVLYIDGVGLDVETGKLLWRSPAYSQCYASALNGMGPLLVSESDFILGCYYNSLSELRFLATNSKTGKPERWSASTPSCPTAGAFPLMSNGRDWLAAFASSTLFLWSVQTGKLLKQRPVQLPGADSYFSQHLDQLDSSAKLSGPVWTVALLSSFTGVFAIDPHFGLARWNTSDLWGVFGRLQLLSLPGGGDALLLTTKDCSIELRSQWSGEVLFRSAKNFTPAVGTMPSGQACLKFAHSNMAVWAISGGAGTPSTDIIWMSLSQPHTLRVFQNLISIPIQEICCSPFSPFLFVQTAGFIHAVSPNGRKQVLIDWIDNGEEHWGRMSRCEVDLMLQVVTFSKRGGGVHAYQLS